ncbi:MAG: hypothetical protein HDR95_06510 [Bacteroides sp.]|nr:hypothetical protein [Bacteroides sp.]
MTSQNKSINSNTVDKVDAYLGEAVSQLESLKDHFKSKHETDPGLSDNEICDVLSDIQSDIKVAKDHYRCLKTMIECQQKRNDSNEDFENSASIQIPLKGRRNSAD